MPQQCAAVEQRFDAQLVDTGHYQNSNQQQGRGHCLDDLNEWHGLGRCFAFAAGQADAGTRQQHRQHQANGAAHQSREFIVNLCQQQVRHRATQDAE
ncbi:hypothetical protein D3C73_896760 [compost metagenome]